MTWLNNALGDGASSCRHHAYVTSNAEQLDQSMPVSHGAWLIRSGSKQIARVGPDSITQAAMMCYPLFKLATLAKLACSISAVSCAAHHCIATERPAPLLHGAWDVCGSTNSSSNQLEGRVRLSMQHQSSANAAAAVWTTHACASASQ